VRGYSPTRWRSRFKFVANPTEGELAVYPAVPSTLIKDAVPVRHASASASAVLASSTRRATSCRGSRRRSVYCRAHRSLFRDKPKVAELSCFREKITASVTDVETSSPSGRSVEVSSTRRANMVSDATSTAVYDNPAQTLRRHSAALAFFRRAFKEVRSTSVHRLDGMPG